MQPFLPPLGRGRWAKKPMRNRSGFSGVSRVRFCGFNRRRRAGGAFAFTSVNRRLFAYIKLEPRSHIDDIRGVFSDMYRRLKELWSKKEGNACRRDSYDKDDETNTDA
jgi:hypothetical protein